VRRMDVRKKPEKKPWTQVLPSLPQRCVELVGEERARRVAPERRTGRTGRPAVPGRDVGQMCAKGGYFPSLPGTRPSAIPTPLARKRDTNVTQT